MSIGSEGNFQRTFLSASLYRLVRLAKEFLIVCSCSCSFFSFSSFSFFSFLFPSLFSFPPFLPSPSVPSFLFLSPPSVLHIYGFRTPDGASAARNLSLLEML